MEQLIISAGFEHAPVKLEFYPDTMPLVKDATPTYPMFMLLRPRSLSDFIAAMFYVDALRERGMHPFKLVLPFIPGARQDRLNDKGDFLFTAKSIAKTINERCFRDVIVLDPHSEVAPALIDNCRVAHAADVMPDSLGEYAAVVAPDAGAEKRALKVAQKLGVPLLRAWKTRDVKTGAISGFGMEETWRGDHVLIVDDICDGGGTFLGLADVLDARGITADLWTTHGIYSQGTAKLLKRFGKLYCTDSYDSNQRDGVTVIECCEGLLFK